MFYKSFLFIYTFQTLCFNAIICFETDLINSKNDNFVGILLKTKRGTEFSAFKGIPYAKPPIGKLRFKAPEKFIPSDEIFNATQDPPICIQKNYLFANPKIEGSEDCLYLNIYTPTETLKEHQYLKPVMVFIHWGGFFAGYANSDYLGPEYFMDSNEVVLVTFNYRLGIFGFFSTLNDASPGNYGLKDQSMALRWIQDNIHYFGGDRNRVTLFGQSAGAASVHYHMLSPMSRGLFHQAISQSGTALALWAKPIDKPNEQIALSKLQGMLIGCNSTSSYKLIECMRMKDANDLLDIGDQLKFFTVDPLNVNLPAIEIKTKNNPNPFITKSPEDYLKNGEFLTVPWIVGVVENEGLVRAAALYAQPETNRILTSKFDNLMPGMMALKMSTDTDNTEGLWDEIKKFYFGKLYEIDINNRKTAQALINLYTDRSFYYSTWQSVLLHLLKSEQSTNVYFYKYSYKGEYSYETPFAANNDTAGYRFGMSHCDELLSLFNTPALFPKITNTNDLKMRQTMIDLWTNFAKHVHPTPHTFSDAYWNKVSIPLLPYHKDIDYLHITGAYNVKDSIRLKMEKGFYNSRLKFWEEQSLTENIKDLHQTHLDLD